MVLLRTTAWEITLKNCSEERKEKLVYMCVCVFLAKKYMQSKVLLFS